MSFIGSDALDHQIRHLKATVASKDAELSSLRSELRKKEEQIAEEQRDKESAVFKAQFEADRAETAEKALFARNAEVSTLKQGNYNLESSLRIANEKLKQEEKENQRLQYELDNAEASGSDDVIRRLKDDKTTLSTKIKDLEATLRKKESEIEANRMESSGANGWGGPSTGKSDRVRAMALENEVKELKEENLRLKANIPLDTASPSRSPSPVFGRSRSRKPSISSSDGAQIATLSAEVERLKGQLADAGNRSSGSADADTLRAKLSAAVTARDKMENQKLALEKSSKKEIEQLRDQLDELKGEVDFYRSNEDGFGGSGGSRKNAEADKLRHELNGKIAELERNLQDKALEVEGAQRKLATLELLQQRLEEEQERRRRAEDLASSPADTAQNTERIAALEAELTEARAAVNAATSNGGPAVQLRQLQRELERLTRERDDLRAEVEEYDKLFAEKDNEIARLQQTVAVATPTASPARLAELEAWAERLAGLEGQVESLSAQLSDKERAYETAVADVQTQRAELVAELDSVRTELGLAQAEEEKLRIELEAVRLESKMATSKNISYETEVTVLRQTIGQLRTELAQQQTVVAEREAALARANDTVAEMTAHKSSMEQDIMALRDSLEALRSDGEAHSNTVTELHNAKAEISRISAELTAAVASRRAADEARASAVAALDQATEGLSDAQATQLSLAAQVMEYEAQLADAQQRAEELATEVTMARQQQDDLNAAKTSALAENEQQRLALDELEEQQRTLAAQVAVLTDRNDDLEAQLGRALSTADAEQQQIGHGEELLALRNDLETVRTELQEERTSHEAELSAVNFAKEQEAKGYLTQRESSLAEMNEISERLNGLEASIALKEDMLREQTRLVAERDNIIATLRASTAPTASSPEQDRLVTLLNGKIASLRAERDDLRQQLSFLSHEGRFALTAAEAERASAVDALTHIQTDIETKSAECQRLEAEITARQTKMDELRSQLQSVNASFAAASSDKQDLVDQVEHLKREVGDLTRDKLYLDKERDELWSNVKAIAASHAALEAKNKALMDASSIAEVTEEPEDTSSLELTGGEEAVLPARPLSRQAERPASRLERRSSRQFGDVAARREEQASQGEAYHRQRRSNGVSSIDFDMYPKQLKALQDKISRREARIEGLERDLKRLELNEANANEARQELEEDLQEVQGSLAAAKADLESKIEEIEAVRTELRVAQTALSQAIIDRDAANAAKSLMAVEMDDLRDAAATIREQQIGDKAEVQALSKRIVDQEQELAGKAVLEVQITALQGQIADAEAMRAELQARLDAEAAATDAQTDLAAEVSVANHENEALRAQLQSKVDELAALNKLVTESSAAHEVALREAQRDLESARSDVEARSEEVTRLQGEVEALTETLVESEAAHGDAVKALQTELQQVKDASEAAQAQAREESAAFLAKLQVADQKSATLEREVETLTAQLAAASADVNASAQRADGLSAEKLELEEQVKSRCQAVEDVEIALNTTKAELAAAVQEKAAIQSQLDAVQAEAAAVKIAMEGRVSELHTKLATVEKDAKQAASMAKFHEGEEKSAKKKLKMLSEELQLASEAETRAKDTMQTLQAEIERLQGEVDELRAAPAASSSSATTEQESETVLDLREQVELLVASLNNKTQELDEADDRVREAHAAKSKLEKKLAKMQRQLAAERAQSETAVNTALNAKLASAPIVPPVVVSAPSPVSTTAPAFMPPPPVPAARTAPLTGSTTVASTPSRTASSVPASPRTQSRQPLRSVPNVFATPQQQQTPISNALKRQRDEPDVLEKPSVDAIMMPPPTLLTTAPSPRQALGKIGGATPSKMNVFGSTGPTAKENAYPTSAPSTAAARGARLTQQRNAFALPPPGAF